jgi:hypothetical protein
MIYENIIMGESEEFIQEDHDEIDVEECIDRIVQIYHLL